MVSRQSSLPFDDSSPPFSVCAIHCTLCVFAGAEGYVGLAVGEKHAAVLFRGSLGCGARLDQGRRSGLAARLFLRVSRCLFFFSFSLCGKGERERVGDAE